MSTANPQDGPWIKSLTPSTRPNPLPALFDEVASLAPSERALRLEKAYAALLADHIEAIHEFGKIVVSLGQSNQQKAGLVFQLQDIIHDLRLELRKQEALLREAQERAKN